jgi:hypothetical protein
MALGVPVHTAVDHMSSMNYAQSMSLSYVMHSLPGSAEQAKRLSEVRFSPPDNAPALWRSATVMREDIVPLDSDEPFETPAFLKRDYDETTKEKIERRIRDIFKSRGDKERKGDTQSATSGASDQPRQYTSPSQILQELSTLAESAPYSAKTLRDFLTPLDIPEHIRSVIEEALSLGDGLAAGVFFLVLSDEIADPRQYLTRRAERWIETGLVSSHDQDLVRRLARKSSNVLIGVTPKQWGPSN